MTGDGGMDQIHAITHRIRELAIQSINDTNEPEDREKLNEEAQRLFQELDALTGRVEFNKNTVLRCEGPTVGTTSDSVMRSTNTIESATFRNAMNSVHLRYTGGPAGTIQPPNSLPGSTIATNRTQYDFTDADGNMFSVHINIDYWAEQAWQASGIAFEVDGQGNNLFPSTFLGSFDPSEPGFIGTMYGASGNVTDQSKKMFALVIQAGMNLALENLGQANSNVLAMNPPSAPLPSRIPAVVTSVTSDGRIDVFSANGFSVASVTCSPAIDGSLGHTIKHMAFGTTTAADVARQTKSWDPKQLWVQSGPNANMGTNFTWDSFSMEKVIYNLRQELREMPTAELINKYGIELTLNLLYNLDDNRGVNLLTRQESEMALVVIDSAQELAATIRGRFGVFMNRLDFVANAGMNAAEHLSSAESGIRDANMAKEMMEFTQTTMLEQAANLQLAQAKRDPEVVLGLLGPS